MTTVVEITENNQQIVISGGQSLEVIEQPSTLVDNSTGATISLPSEMLNILTVAGATLLLENPTTEIISIGTQGPAGATGATGEPIIQGSTFTYSNGLVSNITLEDLQEINFIYNGNSQVSQIENGVNQWDFTYNGSGQVTDIAVITL